MTGYDISRDAWLNRKVGKYVLSYLIEFLMYVFDYKLKNETMDVDDFFRFYSKLHTNWNKKINGQYSVFDYLEYNLPSISIEFKEKADYFRRILARKSKDLDEINRAFLELHAIISRLEVELRKIT